MELAEFLDSLVKLASFGAGVVTGLAFVIGSSMRF